MKTVNSNNKAYLLWCFTPPPNLVGGVRRWNLIEEREEPEQVLSVLLGESTTTPLLSMQASYMTDSPCIKN